MQPHQRPQLPECDRVESEAANSRRKHCVARSAARLHSKTISELSVSTILPLCICRCCLISFSHLSTVCHIRFPNAMVSMANLWRVRCTWPSAVCSSGVVLFSRCLFSSHASHVPLPSTPAPPPACSALSLGDLAPACRVPLSRRLPPPDAISS